MSGYDAGDVPHGIGEVDDEAGGRVFTTVNLGGTVTTLSATHVLDEADKEEGGMRGFTASLSVAYPHQLTRKLTIVPHVAVNWGSDEYMNSYFGVDSVRADRSGLQFYEPEAGVKDVSLGMGIAYQLTRKWRLTGAIEASQLMEVAEDSPFVERETQSKAVVGLTYAF